MSTIHHGRYWPAPPGRHPVLGALHGRQERGQLGSRAIANVVRVTLSSSASSVLRDARAARPARPG